MSIRIRRARLAIGAVAIAGAVGLLAACSSDFDEEQAEVEVRETFDLFTAAVFAGDGPVACALMTENLKEDLFTVGPTMATPEGGSCEGRMGQQGSVIRDANGGKDPTVELQVDEIATVADDGSQPFAPGGLVAWADTQAVVDGEPEPMRFFLLREDWLIGSLPPTFTPPPVLGGAPAEQQQSQAPQ